MENAKAFNKAAVQYFDTGDASLAYRKIGQGPALVFVHGFPVYGYTWRHLLPTLSKTYTCYVLDLPGLGHSKWTKQTDFHFSAQSQRIIEFMEAKEIQSSSLIAHDTGATTARLVALSSKLQIKNLILINTEVPNHRPPWIPLYQKASLLPLSHHFFKASLKNTSFIRSSMGFKAFYADKQMLRIPENIGPYIDLATRSSESVKGALRYLRGCDLKFMDGLKDRHKEIKAKVLLIWGEQDVTFPVAYGEQLQKQFKDASLYKIKEAALMPHEEKPDEVLAILKENMVNA